MGRAKSNLEFIKKEKLRNKTFRDRNNTVKKKFHELTTLCDIKAVVIIYGPKQAAPQAHPLEPEIWPENRDEVLDLIKKYKSQSPEDRNSRTTLLSDFFKERNKKAQQALNELRKNNIQSKYPTKLNSRLSSLKEEELRQTVVFLENNIRNAKAKLEQMKANPNMKLSKKRIMNFEAENRADKYLKIHPHQSISKPMSMPGPMPGPMSMPGPMPMPFPIQQQRIPFTDYSQQNQMMVTFGNEYMGGTSNIVHNAPLSNVACDYPMMGGTLNSISYGNNFAMPFSNYYGEGRQPIAQPYMIYHHPMTQESTSHQMAAGSHHYYEDRKWQM